MMHAWHVMPMFGSLFLMLFWVTLFFLVLKVQPWQKKRESNLEIAKRRYAQGEIDEQKLNEIKNNL
ncbi:hypothetical protein [Psychromonas hadalis]|uniref:hypothetical protein n=1 Tax=Psychromonas hadalis TaxID=211669 RepID=UPI0003B77C0D|nr:hypothetical protein [Psychromonas hadalis]